MHSMCDPLGSIPQKFGKLNLEKPGKKLRTIDFWMLI